jgi:two-component system OmpR family response regulator
MPDSSQPHILIVDADPSIRELLTEYFAENGLPVSTAASGAEMSSILQDAAMDLVVLDLRLAGEDGMEIARRLRSESVIPLIS